MSVGIPAILNVNVGMMLQWSREDPAMAKCITRLVVLYLLYIYVCVCVCVLMMYLHEYNACYIEKARKDRQ